MVEVSFLPSANSRKRASASMETSRFPDSGFQIPESREWKPESGFWIPDARFWFLVCVF